jgi:hypothetical protein
MGNQNREGINNKKFLNSDLPALMDVIRKNQDLWRDKTE